MDTRQIDLFARKPAAATVKRQRAKDARDTGIERSGERADRDEANWTERAALAIGSYARSVGGPFLIEDARESAGISAPPDGRAWGKATTRAARDGLIRKVGYAPSRSSNLSPKVQWVAA